MIAYGLAHLWVPMEPMAHGIHTMYYYYYYYSVQRHGFSLRTPAPPGNARRSGLPSPPAMIRSGLLDIDYSNMEIKDTV